jgi:hypothetical protein
MSIRRLACLFLALLVAGCGGGEKSRIANPDTSYLAGGGGAGGTTGSSPQGPNSADSLPGASSGYDSISYWDGDGVQGAPHIVVNLGEQRAYFYKGDELVGISQVSAGREGHDTPSGNFKIIGKDIGHSSSIYGDYVDATGNVIQANITLGKDPKPPGAIYRGAPMHYYMQILPAVGMHEGYLPGYPASHGCIRMPSKMAQVFFKNVNMGTPVQVIK